MRNFSGTTAASLARDVENTLPKPCVSTSLVVRIFGIAYSNFRSTSKVQNVVDNGAALRNTQDQLVLAIAAAPPGSTTAAVAALAAAALAEIARYDAGGAQMLPQPPPSVPLPPATVAPPEGAAPDGVGDENARSDASGVPNRSEATHKFGR